MTALSPCLSQIVGQHIKEPLQPLVGGLDFVKGGSLPLIVIVGLTSLQRSTRRPKVQPGTLASG